MGHGEGIWRITPSLWRKTRKVIYDRANDICEKCGLSVKDLEDTNRPVWDIFPPRWVGDRGWAGNIRTDRPMWTAHHIIPIRELRETVREACKELIGEEYFLAVKKAYLLLATDINNLELRCSREECRRH